MIHDGELARVEEFLDCVRRVQDARAASQSLACRVDERAAAAAAATIEEAERALARAVARLSADASPSAVDDLAAVGM